MSGFDPHWGWFALGLALGAAEIAAPGFFLIWLAAAALLTGVIVWTVPIGFPLQVVIFAVVALVTVLAARRWLSGQQASSADPLLNDRGGRLVGEMVMVTEAIVAGQGRVRQGDGEWLARGPDMPVGARARIAAHDGTVLIVEPLG